MEEENKNKALLIILDGWGLSPITEGNAPLLAHTPVLDYVYASYPKVSLAASGLEVGLNRGEMGNSEVGHLNIGSGRVVWENLPRIDYAVESGAFHKNQVLGETLEQAKKSKLHLVGLVSTGGVHSHFRHLVALLEAAKSKGVREVYVHFISDGRDTPPRVAADYAKNLQKEFKRIGVGKFGSLVGRYFAMDRDKRWERTKKAYDLYVKGEGAKFNDITEAIQNNYSNGKGDEFIEPALLDENAIIGEGDAVIFFNFRSDRMRQIVESFITKDFSNFTIQDNPSLHIISMTQYEKSYAIPILFNPVNLNNVLADVIELNNKTQCHIAETEKYAHVTYFFNGGREEKHRGEVQLMVPSPKVETYDQLPEMSALQVAEQTEKAMTQNFDFIVVNFANGDMVGHTGDLEATMRACETVDKCLFSVLSKASVLGYNTIITADHGNCEMMKDPATGQPSTEHTTSPVPFVYLGFKDRPFEMVSNFSFSSQDLVSYSAEPYRGVLSDLAPTIIDIMGLKRPLEIDGVNLIEVI